jgi:hypothetical protein
MSADIYTGGMIGAKTVGRSGVWGVGDKGITYPDTLATGGTITVDGDYIVHTFTASGAFTPLVSSITVEYLVVAGGGGGGTVKVRSSRGGGGGGAGGYLTATGLTVSGSCNCHDRCRRRRFINHLERTQRQQQRLFIHHINRWWWGWSRQR